MRTPKSASGQNRTSQKQLTQKTSTTSRGALFVAVTLLLATSAWGQGKVLYSFSGPPDGEAPSAGLVRDAAGNLYGATPAGGNTTAEQCENGINGCGVVFELTNSGGTWTESIIHTFVPGSGDGINPYGNLILNSAGNLYGTTEYGGTTCTGYFCGVGTVYELSPAGGGLWTETILYNFQAAGDGIYPEAGLIMDSAGNLYGTTGFGGNNAICNTLGCGTVFELSPGSGGTWTEHIL
ncbi:MAG: choice-of-anchor tandem repeat GloVer-containing protein [Candidatus Sulfotelmatobacter sp.]